MASDLAAAANFPAESNSETFTLQILSPSVGIPQPLALRKLPIGTTVKQLKERIRDVVSTKPADQAQRLIHRGRLLARDDETMADIFGQETLRSADHQTLHLVLRELSDSQTTTSGQPSAGANPLPQHPPHPPHPSAFPFQPDPQVRVGIPHYHGIGFGFQRPIPGIPVAGQPMMPPPGSSSQQYSQWARSMNAHLGARDQNQRTATTGAQGTPIPGARGTPGTSTPGRTASPFQPEVTRTTIRESTGPNGLHWRITYNETFVNPPQRPGNPWGPQARPGPNGSQFSDNDAHNILRAADTSAATRAMADAMRRNASSSSLASLAPGQAQHPIPPGITTPLIPSRGGSATATPDPLRAAGQPRILPVQQNQTQAPSSQNTPEVYILSSPSGPRALLLNGSLDTYFSPPARTTNPPTGIPFAQRQFPLTFGNALHPQYTAPVPTPATQSHIPSAGPSHTGGHREHNAAQAQHQHQVQQQHGLHQVHQVPHIGHAVARADNPQIQAIRIAHIWPHIWLITRLGVFIWLFSSPNSSWSRWFFIIGASIAIFLARTGLLTPVADQLWVPFRRRLENLIPFADGHHDVQVNARGGGAQGANNGAVADGQRQERELRPADTAARLVQQRRNANANWLMDQARRLERAGILFLASIAPGVAERHIAQVEAEARAERIRREEAEAAAAAAQQSEGQENAEQAGESDTATAAASEESGSWNQTPEGERGNERPPAAEEPLVAL
ncbi:uncharacterized protein F4812DRAFT_352472 [Daldinia caldariorum]|uniref:uncharacterized protein n=1 Tax=Daldinia caldariorum TaxID=326644 RepID=UPI002008D626|nr:uncharacterized protein F4812DRAFT_352472 [Daldinia caldariorum]KAI1468940.1 hypothetical protein F4812DRAFT_352472 [Daldinia caldariorum]